MWNKLFNKIAKKNSYWKVRVFYNLIFKINMETKKIKIVDVTLREWDQAPLTSFNAIEKSMISLMLSEMWIDVIEVWFGFSRADFENIKKVSKIVWERKTVISSLWRALESDTIASLEALEEVNNPRIHIFLAMSKEHINWKFWKIWNSFEERQKKLLIQAKTEIERAKQWAEKNNKNLEIEFSPEDATWNALILEKDWKKYFRLKNNSDFDFLIKVCEEAIKSWATIINIPDTLGNLLPHQSYEFFKKVDEKLNHLKQNYNFWLSCHIHNDLAMATANAIESIRWWASYVETTLLWIWERAWNTSTHEIIWILKEKWNNLIDWENVELNSEFKFELIWPITDFVKNIIWVDKYLQTPFIWALSDIDGSWVHNAAVSLYWGSKNKKQFGWSELPEFFSPRWWANQIVNMLEKFWIKEEKKSDNISKTTINCAKKSEILKSMYSNNVLATYLETKKEFNIEKIELTKNKLDLEIILKWKKISFIWETKDENWVINTFINLINKKIWKDRVKIKKIEIKSKTNLKQEYNNFCKKIEKYKIKLSKDFYKKAEEILKSYNDIDDYSKAKSINHIILEIDWKEIYSVASDKNVTIWNVKAILEWVLNIL